VGKNLSHFVNPKEDFAQEHVAQNGDVLKETYKERNSRNSPLSQGLKKEKVGVRNIGSSNVIAGKSKFLKNHQ
jgi:hypothetical protein